jgi:hypothetical protein
MIEKKPKRFIETLLNLSKEERVKQAFSHLKSRKDLPALIPLLTKLLNSDRQLGLLFLTDPLQFFKDMDIKLTPGIKKHFLKVMTIAQKSDRKAYNEIKAGKGRLGYIKSISFELPPNIVEQVPKYHPPSLPQKGVAEIDFSDRMRFLVPDHGLRPVTAGPRPPVPLLLDTGGWDIAAEIHESFLRDLWHRYFYSQFALAILARLGGIEESELVEPWHDFYSWFLVFLHLHLSFEVKESSAPPIPIEFSLGTESSDLIKIILRINCELRVRSTPSEPWSTPDHFTAVVEKSVQPFRKEQGVFAGQTLENYYAVDLTAGDMMVNVVEYPDDVLIRTLVEAAVNDFIRTEIPELPVTPPLSDNPPFMVYGRSQVYNIDSHNDRDALAIVFGQTYTPLQNYLIKNGNNFGLGMSSAVMHYLIRSQIPPVPIWNEEKNVETKKIEVELRDSYIYTYGNGTYHTGACLPNVNFDYGVKIRLSIDNEGNLVANADEPDVNISAWWLKLILYAALGPLVGIVADIIIRSIIESLVGQRAGEEIEQYLDISINVQNMFSGTFGPVALTASIPEVAVTRNGIFFDGNLSITETYRSR